MDKARDHMEIVPNKVVWETVVSIYDTYSDLSDFFESSQNNFIYIRGMSYVQETATTILTTKKNRFC